MSSVESPPSLSFPKSSDPGQDKFLLNSCLSILLFYTRSGILSGKGKTRDAINILDRND